MKKIYNDLLSDIPEFESFLTLSELDESSRNLAKKHPDNVSLFSIGKSKEGRDLLCLKIGSGSRNALMFGCPHPNEPIGTMMLEYFSEALANSEELRKELDYTWYIVKAWDADGLVKNQGWLKGPYNVGNYSRHFFRPAGHQQVDWTFPVNYKELNFERPIPETRAMMNLIDEIKPHFIYSLHNAGFGGVYWYLSEALPELYEDLYKAAERVGVPLNLGEPETPYCEALAPAVYRSLGIEQDYDYLEKYGAKNIGEILNVGNCSESYAREKYGSFTLLTELPYFYDKRIMDLSDSNSLRKDCVLRSLESSEKQNTMVNTFIDQLKNIIDDDNQYLMALIAFSKNENIESTRKMVTENPEYARPATVAEEFDSLYLSRFYRLLSLGMLVSLCNTELEREGLENSDKDVLIRIARKAEELHIKETEILEKELDYEVVPIKKLISIQLESGIIVAEYLKKYNP